MKMRYVFSTVAVSAFIMLAGCGGQKASSVKEAAPAAEIKTGAVVSQEPVIRSARKDEIGRLAVCPVMGTKFNVNATTMAADYNGKTYYFCCAGCPDEFKKNPEKYVK
jgi:YHS domain-containing protein